MAFSLGKRAGWNRLWLVLSVLWWVFIAVATAANVPNEADIERDYQRRLEQASTTPVYPDGPITRETFGKHRPPTEFEISVRKGEAHMWQARQMDELPARKRDHVVQAVLASLVPLALYAVLFVLVLVIRWISRGFRG